MCKFVATSAVLAYYVGGVRISVKSPDLCVVKAGGIEARMRPGDAIRHGGSPVIRNSGVTILFTRGGFVVKSPKNQPVRCVSAIMAGGSIGIKNSDMSWFFPSSDGIQEGWFADVKVNSKIGVFIKVRGDVLDWWWRVASYSHDLRVRQADPNDNLVGPDEYEEVRENEWYR